MQQGSADSACPNEEDIAGFLRGSLAVQRMGLLEAHIAHCSACRQLVSALARAAAMESRAAADTVSPTLPLEPRAGETELALGTRFGRYAVVDWIGAGGMGVVYSAWDSELNRKIALKVLRNDGAEHAPIHDALLREAQAMAQLAHPNVVTVFDVGSVDGRVFIAMELVQGTTLSKWLTIEPREPSEVVATFLAAGQGLAAAHAAGLIHRDFKPDNVLIGNDGRVRVTDFGLARPTAVEPLEARHRGAAGARAAGGVPQTGLAGTLAYMAPERLARRAADARADQFSFAVALYEALYGERPFALRELAGETASTGRRAVVPPRSSVPLALRQALARALSPEPDERFPSMRELLVALAPTPRRGRAVAGGAVLVAVSAVAAAGGYTIHLRHAAEQRTELVGRLRGLVPEMRTQLRNAHMLPLHDIRAAREVVRSKIREVENQRQLPAAQDARALIDFVLGEGHRALGDSERAVGLLEAAWAAGERGPHIDAALGDALGAMYESRLSQIEATVPASRRETEIRAVETRYRDPALVHLRAALAAKASAPAYLEGLIAFHDHRFAEASRSAHAAFAEAPMFYEAGVLEAKAHHEIARQLLTADKTDEANPEFAMARHTFERVLEIARSDDEAWLNYGEMVFAEANALIRDRIPPELQRQAIAALHTARRINPGRWLILLREAEIYEKEANIAIIRDEDPGVHVEQVLALANEARALGADADEVDVNVCLVHWEQAVYQGSHGIDPHPAFRRAITACESAIAIRPNADKYASLGAVYSSLAAYDADHGGDPTHTIELSDRNLRAAIGIGDNALLHYNLGRLWVKAAHYHANHGQSPETAVDRALVELETSFRMDATRIDAVAAMSDALLARARFQRAQRQDAAAALARARAEAERALALDAQLVPPIWYRLVIAELDAEELLERHSDPAPVVARMVSDAQQLLRRLPNDRLAHRAWCWAELLAARWALAHGGAVNDALARATTEAALARQAGPTDALAWTASAEVEQLRAKAARARGAAPDAAIARGQAFIAHAMTIDPRHVRTLKVRDQLASWAVDR